MSHPVPTGFVLSLGLALSIHAQPAVDFARDIQPLFAEHCLECHGPDASKGGLLLTNRDSALKELESGQHGIVPGDPAHSAIIERVLAADPDDQMPPKDKKRLKPREIELLKAWIAAGAKFDEHWAYKPVKTFPKSSSSPSERIDQFVRTKLDEAAIRPSAEADRLTLIKRVHYDLLGLPPTPEEIDQFVADSSPKAFEALIDRTLASPHFGERWGRHWLDAARYADSDGYEKDRPRPDAWRFRDWVIRAINDDMPFDQFTVEQLAGDLLPGATPEQVVATAFNRQTLTNTEGGTDQEQFRVEAVFDRTETLGTVWLGLTIGCARCHTHKYDQISQREYYQLFAFFNNGDEVTRQVPESPEKWQQFLAANGSEATKLEELQKRVDEAKAALPVKLPAWEQEIQARLAKAKASKSTQTFQPLALKTVKAGKGSAFKKQPDQCWLATGKEAATDTYVVEIAPLKQPITALRIEVLPDDSLPSKGPGRSVNGNFVLSELRLDSNGLQIPLHTAEANYAQKSFDAKLAIDGSEDKGWAVGGKAGTAHHLTVQLATPLASGQPLTIRLVQNYKVNTGHLIGRFRILAASEVTEASIVPSDVSRVLNEEPRRRNPVVIKSLFDFLERVHPEVVSATAALEQARAKLPKAPLMDVRVIAQRSQNARATRLMHRGNFLDPADEVKPGVLGVLPSIAANPSNPTRLDLARWLVSPNHPLTPRVAVNQIWGKLFGEGLVRTAADFGVRGEKPANPDLLDFLARHFIEQGWSRKKLLKTILLTATYRQISSQAHRTPEELSHIQAVDPLNFLLWRQNRLRVEGEIVRDLHLAASGLLSRKIGGPSVFPPMPPDIADLSYANNFKWTTSTGEDRFRRGLYTFFKRTAPHPDLTTFDCPDANLTSIKRTVSNTPLQALTTLNAESFAEAARALAQRLLTSSSASDEQRIHLCYQLCLGRLPSTREATALRQLLADSRKHYQSSPREAAEMTGTYAPKGISVTEAASWAAAARIVLNTDEFITRE